MQYDSINYQYTRLLPHAALPKLETFIFLPASDGYQCVINEEFQRYLGFERNRLVGFWLRDHRFRSSAFAVTDLADHDSNPNIVFADTQC